MTKPKKRPPLEAYRSVNPATPPDHWRRWSQAVVAGELAAAAGADATANPHAEGTPEHDGWQVGFDGVERAYAPPAERALAERKPQLELF